MPCTELTGKSFYFLSQDTLENMMGSLGFTTLKIFFDFLKIRYNLICTLQMFSKITI